jgi:sulfite exporter TauE/SafE
VTALVAAVFVASLLGSLHCAGMCGGVLALCFGLEGERRGCAWVTHAAYHGGRGATYVLLGALAGSAGAVFDLGGARLGFPRAAAVLAGILMIGCGAMTLIRRRGAPRRAGCGSAGGAGAKLAAVFRRGMVAVIDRPPAQRALLIGLLTGLLPCGWLWAFVATAAGTGGAATGALAMAVFWSGTLPVMVGLGLGVQRLGGPIRKHLPALSAVLVMAVGGLTVLGRVQLPAAAASVAVSRAESLEDAADQVHAIDHGELPCCHAGE